MRYQDRIFNGLILPALNDGAAKWIAFVLLSYLIGHFVFLAGSSILDPIYVSSYRKYKSKATGDLLRDRAAKLKDDALKEHREVENEYKWARGIVRLKNQSAAAEIDRLEANSKFFRSMVVVLFAAMLSYTRNGALALNIGILALLYLRTADLSEVDENPEARHHDRVIRPIKFLVALAQSWKRTALILHLIAVAGLIVGAFAWRTTWLPQAGCLLLVLLSFWCFADQRWKMTQTAYLYFVILSSTSSEPKPVAD
jgi:hypothetical protein